MSAVVRHIGLAGPPSAVTLRDGSAVHLRPASFRIDAGRADAHGVEVEIDLAARVPVLARAA
jgi:hypothetical protein